MEDYRFPKGLLMMIILSSEMTEVTKNDVDFDVCERKATIRQAALGIIQLPGPTMRNKSPNIIGKSPNTHCSRSAMAR